MREFLDFFFLYIIDASLPASLPDFGGNGEREGDGTETKVVKSWAKLPSVPNKPWV